MSITDRQHLREARTMLLGARQHLDAVHRLATPADIVTDLSRVTRYVENMERAEADWESSQ